MKAAAIYVKLVVEGVARRLIRSIAVVVAALAGGDGVVKASKGHLDIAVKPAETAIFSRCGVAICRAVGVAGGMPWAREGEWLGVAGETFKSCWSCCH